MLKVIIRHREIEMISDANKNISVEDFLRRTLTLKIFMKKDTLTNANKSENDLIKVHLSSFHPGDSKKNNKTRIIDIEISRMG